MPRSAFWDLANFCRMRRAATTFNDCCLSLCRLNDTNFKLSYPDDLVVTHESPEKQLLAKALTSKVPSCPRSTRRTQKTCFYLRRPGLKRGKNLCWLLLE
jgi:hypothetical protein